MEKLQYETLYKFLVSAGVILIIGPCFGLYYLISGTFNMIISKEDYLKLSNYSRQLICYKSLWLNKTFSFLPTIFIILILIGIFFLVIGCIRWAKIQSLEDKSTKLETDKKFYELIQDSSEELTIKLLKKFAIEHKDVLTTENSIVTSVNRLANLVDKHGSDFFEQSSVIIKELKAFIEKSNKRTVSIAALGRQADKEKQFFEYLRRNSPQNYIIKRNLHIGGFYYDIIACSDKEKDEKIYEIYCVVKDDITSNILEKKARRLSMATAHYNHEQNRHAVPILIIIAKDPLLQERQEEIKKVALKPSGSPYPVETQFFTFTELQ